MREFLAPDASGKKTPEERYNHLSLTVGGQDMEVERHVSMGVITVDGYEITIFEMEPEREVKCIVMVERIQ